MDVLVWVMRGWGKVTETLMSRRCRNLWALTVTLMLLTFLYGYTSINPTEPYIKRSHSSTTGSDSIEVVFANRENNKGNVITNNIPNNPTKLANQSLAPAAGRSLLGVGVRVKEIPFEVEKQFDMKKLNGKYMDVLPTLSPAENNQSGIPSGILKMFESNEETKDVPVKKMPAKPPLKDLVQKSSKPILPVSSNSATHKDLSSIEPRHNLGALNSPSKDKTRVPDWVRSGFFSDSNHETDSPTAFETPGIGTVNIMYTDLFAIDKQEEITNPDSRDETKVEENLFEFEDLEDLGSPYDVRRDQVKTLTFDGAGQIPQNSPFLRQFQSGGKKNRQRSELDSTKSGKRGRDQIFTNLHIGEETAEERVDGNTDWESLLISPDELNVDTLLEVSDRLPHPSAEKNHQYLLNNHSQLGQLPQAKGIGVQLHSKEEDNLHSDDSHNQLYQSFNFKSDRNQAYSDKFLNQLDLNDPDETSTIRFGDDLPYSAETVTPKPIYFSKHKSPIGKLLEKVFERERTISTKLPFDATRDKKANKNLHDHSDVDFAKSRSKNPQNPSSDNAEESDFDYILDPDVDSSRENSHGHYIFDSSKTAMSTLKTELKYPGTVLKGSERKHAESKIQNPKGFNLTVWRSNLTALKHNLTAWKGVLKERKRLLRAKCDENRNFKANIQNTNAIVDRKRNFLYCPVAESASGYFYRFMYTLKHTNRTVKLLPSPFDVSLQEALADDLDTLRGFHKKGLEDFVENSLRFIVVREPFSRLFSAYVDMLLVPDSFYWKQWGVQAISKYRKYPSSKSLACGNDVSFSEFIKFVIDILHYSDDIVKPVNTLCLPCELRYSAIGHVETLATDIEYVTSLLKISISNFSAETLMNEVFEDIISDSTYKAFEYYEHLQSCISKYEMGKRLWRKLQIRGIISEELTFSFAPKKVDKMTPTQFIQLVYDARKTLPDSDKFHQQKFDALKTAFENVPAEDIMQLVKIYALDFEFFGYDRHPSFLL